MEYDGLKIEPSYLDFLRSQGYTIDEVKDLKTVRRKDSETGHLVCKIQTYHFPMDSPQLDLEKHRCTVAVCDCPDFRYRKSADITDPTISPAECGACSHIQEAYKEERAKNDENQATLEL